MKSFIPNHFKSLCAALIFGISAPIAMSEGSVHADPLTPCPSGLSYAALLAIDGCGKTPDLYRITVYKLALCTADPFTGSGFDTSFCELTFDSPSGTVATLYDSGAPLTVTLSGSTAPPPNTYTHAAILIGTDFQIKNSYTTSDNGTYYSTSTFGVVDQSPPAEIFTKNQTDFSNGESCTASGTMALGTLSARILDSSNSFINLPTGGTCLGAHRIAAVMSMATPISITTSTNGIIATFTVTNVGSTIFASDGAIVFDNGPFQISFSAIE